MNNRETQEQAAVKRTLQDLVYTVIDDRTKIILQTPDNKMVGKGRWFEDHILDHMHDDVKTFMKVGANTIVVHLDK